MRPNFPSWHPGSIEYTPNCLRWSRFFILSHPFHPKRLRRPTKGPALPLPATRKPGTARFSSDFSDTSLSSPSFLRPVCFPSAVAYHPVATGNPSILPRTAPSSQRVRCPSAGKSQQWGAIGGDPRSPEIDLQASIEGELKGLVLFPTHWLWTSGACSSNSKPHKYRRPKAS
jgi:hypothetical protein